jgi:hypothetical protein
VLAAGPSRGEVRRMDMPPSRDEAPAASTVAAAARPSIWTRPISYRAQCWIAWAGLTAFGVRGVMAWRAGGDMDLERLTAAVLSVAWGSDLLRNRSTEVG